MATATIPPTVPGSDFLNGLGISSYDDLSNIIGVIGAMAAACVFIVQFAITIHQRNIEQRRTRAALARELLDQIFTDPRSRDALRMLDYDARTYVVGGTPTPISAGTVQNGLRIKAARPHKRDGDTHDETILSFTPEELYVRDCFECLFDQIDILEHFIRRNLLDSDDLRPPLSYYAKKISTCGNTFSAFLHEYEYNLTMAFLRRFSKNPDVLSAPTKTL